MNDSIVPPVKRCNKCGEEFPRTPEYWHKTNTGDGLVNSCKSCAINRAKVRYQLKRDEIRAKEKTRYESKRDEINTKKREAYKQDPSKVSKQNKSYRERNKEKVAKGKKDYNRRNTEAVKEKRRRRYAETRDESITASSAYYHVNKSQIKERRRGTTARYNQIHREEKRLWALEYYKNNPQKAKMKIHRRLARKRNLPSTLTSDQWERCLSYFDHKCAVCSRSIGFWHTLAADHWIPLASPNCLGTVVENMIPLCHGSGGCNNSKGAKDAILWLTEKFGKKKAKQILNRINAYFEWAKQQD